tara:strand:+ start:479 stop:1018 length:540 start_codon:yes stop_codon:yes gene_type:complete
MNKILDKLMDSSVLKEHKRGMRRYFPLKSTELHSEDMATEVVSYFTGGLKEDIGAIRFAYIFHSLDKRVEKFDGYWVRTIYRIPKIDCVVITGLSWDANGHPSHKNNWKKEAAADALNVSIDDIYVILDNNGSNAGNPFRSAWVVRKADLEGREYVSKRLESPNMEDKILPMDKVRVYH